MIIAGKDLGREGFIGSSFDEKNFTELRLFGFVSAEFTGHLGSSRQ